MGAEISPDVAARALIRVMMFLRFAHLATAPVLV
jgi:hypothetical protein